MSPLEVERRISWSKSRTCEKKLSLFTFLKLIITFIEFSNQEILTFLDKEAAEYIKTAGAEKVTAKYEQSQLRDILETLSGKSRSIFHSIFASCPSLITEILFW